MPGGMLSLSANGNTPGTGIVWATLSRAGNPNQATQPGIVRAYDASDATKELWNSEQNAGRDSLGNFSKFSAPTIANGKMYVATFSNKLVAYGLLGNPGSPPPVVNPPPGSGSGLLGQYYRDSGTGARFTTLVITRTDPTVNFSWGGGAPGSGMPGDNFSVRWTGQVQAPVTGTYTFSTVSDDGVRLFVNGHSSSTTGPSIRTTTNAAPDRAAGRREVRHQDGVLRERGDGGREATVDLSRSVGDDHPPSPSSSRRSRRTNRRPRTPDQIR